MTVSTDQLIAALFDQRFYLEAEEGGINLHCRDCYCDRTCAPLAHYDPSGDWPLYSADLAVANVATVPSLWAEAVKHLQGTHEDGDSTSHG